MPPPLKPSDLEPGQVTLQELADLRFPEEAKHLKKLKASGSPEYPRLLQKHLSRIYHLVREGKLEPKRVRGVYIFKQSDGKSPSDDLPPHFKSAKEIAIERGMPLTRNKYTLRRTNAIESCLVAQGGFLEDLEEIRKKQENAGTPIAQRAPFTDSMGRNGRKEWKYDTLRLYPILEARKVENAKKARAAERETKFLAALDLLDQDRKGASKRIVAELANFHDRFVNDLVASLFERKVIEEVQIRWVTGRGGRCHRTWTGIRRVASDGITGHANSHVDRSSSPETAKSGKRGRKPSAYIEQRNERCYEEYAKVRRNEQKLAQAIIRVNRDFPDKPVKDPSCLIKFAERGKADRPWPPPNDCAGNAIN